MAFKLFDRVQETSTSTGTGNLTLSGAVDGYSTFASRYSTGDTLYYGVHAVNASGVPTGEWEIGFGTYSAANTLTRTTVLASSNSDAAVSLSVGNKRAFVTMTALQGSFIREKITADRTYYVRTDGSDSNTGLADTAGGAFLTVQKAFDVLATIDGAGYAATIQVADGTYTASIVTKPCLGLTTVTLQGNSGTPANVVITTSSGETISHSSTSFTLAIKDLKVTSSGATLIYAFGNSSVSINNIDCGSTSAGGQHLSASNGAIISVVGNYTISAGTGAHIVCTTGAYVNGFTKTVTLSGTPAFSVAFIYMSTNSSVQLHGITYSGSATGSRYSVNQNSVCSTNGGGANYFPGNSAGASATGGQYV